MDLKEKNKKAKAEIIAALREKFKTKIDLENSRIEREQKFADSLIGVDPAQKVIENHKKRVKNNDVVKIKLDRKTIIFVAREKCVQNEDGTWSKKQN